MSFISILQNNKYYEDIQKKADELNNKYDEFIIVGVGGSFAAAKSIYDIFCLNSKKLQFIYFLDKIVIDQILNNSNKKRLFIFISKSGKTIEVLALLEYITNLGKNLGYNRFLFITDTNKEGNTLLNIANNTKYDILHHESDISGRFSFTTNIAFLPLALAGININQFRHGLLDCIEDSIDEEFIQIMLSHQIKHNILMSYDIRFVAFNNWYAQLFAESICKRNIFNVVPVINTGTIDQHSVLECYLSNAEDKFLTVLHINENSDILIDISSITGLKQAQMISLSKLQQKELLATVKTANELGLKNRIIEIDLSVRNLGYLMMKFALEIIKISDILQINPFVQEMVELRKENSIKILQKYEN
jgi:glucose-6-phosphate isomerase